MLDRELLELAAKAAGYEVRWYESWECFVRATPNIVGTGGQERMPWRPLDDDGDAFRLAVKLRLGMQVCHAWTDVTDGTLVLHENNAAGDPCAAARRAIVRTAAAMAT